MDEETLQHKQYIGDGVYVGFDGYQIWIYTSNGLHVTNKIALEPPVLENLQRWIEDLSRKVNEAL